MVVGIAILVILAWWYLIDMALEMRAMSLEPAMATMGASLAWGPRELLLLFAMWAVMMVAMMLPSATPMLLAFATVNRRRQRSGRAGVPVAVFAAAYLLTWALYSLLATAIQWGLHHYALMTPLMVSNNELLSGAILMAAGLFQCSGLKQRCLQHCRSPLSFLMSHWREGYRGAWHMGFYHGSYCVGCCWLLMAVLFVTGVMNLVAVFFLALMVLVEKTLKRGLWFSRLTGLALLLIGLGWIL